MEALRLWVWKCVEAKEGKGGKEKDRRIKRLVLTEFTQDMFNVSFRILYKRSGRGFKPDSRQGGKSDSRERRGDEQDIREGEKLDIKEGENQIQGRGDKSK